MTLYLSITMDCPVCGVKHDMMTPFDWPHIKRRGDVNEGVFKQPHNTPNCGMTEATRTVKVFECPDGAAMVWDEASARPRRIMERDGRSAMKVYLAGPIFGCTDEQCKAWREKAKELLPGFEVLDPMSRDYRGKEGDNVADIVLGDKEDIRNSDAVLANAWKASWGTSMEVMYANVNNVRVVAFGAGDRPSPWLVYHTELFATLEQACEALRGQ